MRLKGNAVKEREWPEVQAAEGETSNSQSAEKERIRGKLMRGSRTFRRRG